MSYGWSTQGNSPESWKYKLCYDNTNCRVAKEERCFGKTIGRNRELIAKPSIETRVGTTLEAYGRKGTRIRNS